MEESIGYLSLWVWLILLNSFLLHSFSCRYQNFFYGCVTLLYIYHIFFICSFVGGHLGRFHFLVTVNSMAIAVDMQASLACWLSLWGWRYTYAPSLVWPSWLCSPCFEAPPHWFPCGSSSAHLTVVNEGSSFPTSPPALLSFVLSVHPPLVIYILLLRKYVHENTPYQENSFQRVWMKTESSDLYLQGLPWAVWAWLFQTDPLLKIVRKIGQSFKTTETKTWWKAQESHSVSRYRGKGDKDPDKWSTKLETDALYDFSTLEFESCLWLTVHVMLITVCAPEKYVFYTSWDYY